MGNLWTPWRLRYILADKSGPECVFCDAYAGSDDRSSLVLKRGRHAFAMLNRYPYNNGHVMVAPVEHVARLGATAPATLAAVMRLAALVESALERVYRPAGFNLGMNLGRSAGAGVVGHLHLHVVPRWEGDTNYMAVINDVRVIPERLEDSWDRVAAALAAAVGDEF